MHPTSGSLGRSTCAGLVPLLMLRRSARCMRALLRFWMGAHSLPIVLGRRTGARWTQRLCQRTDQHAIGDERHMLLQVSCSAVRARQVCCTLCAWCLHMQNFMWQVDIAGVAHFI